MRLFLKNTSILNKKTEIFEYYFVHLQPDNDKPKEMFSIIDILLTSITLTVSLSCGAMIWVKRHEVRDRSRIYLFIMEMVAAVGSLFFLAIPIFNIHFTASYVILDPILSIVGLYGITFYMYYPLEVMRPGQLRGRQSFLLWLPSILTTLPVLFGLKFQTLHSWDDLMEHLYDFDVLLRLFAVFSLTIFSISLLVIPYNWRRSSADNRWIRRAALFAQIMSICFFCHVFTCRHISYLVHMLWTIIMTFCLTYYELHLRVLPSVKSEEEPAEGEPESNITSINKEETDNFWPSICQVMDELEAWRNPNTTVETVSTAIGTNRIYVARCIKEHTGKTFNDYMNEKRINYMADQLRLNPRQDHKQLYFDVGFRSRHTAYRNFVKFIGCSPTDFAASLM